MSRRAAILLTCALAVAGLRDPFAPPPPPAVEPTTPLQRLEIDRVRLVALVYRPVARALLEDDHGNGYIAAPGVEIGPRRGTVVAIEPGTLRIREPAASDDVVLTLRAPRESAR